MGCAGWGLIGMEATATTGVLEAELETYLANKDALLEEAEGKWVLIHGSEIAGIRDSEREALKLGYSRFGPVPFLVEQISRTEPVQFLYI
jgi:hypothetical protein